VKSYLLLFLKNNTDIIMKHIINLLFMCLLLSSCASSLKPIDQLTVDELSKNIQVSDSPFDSKVKITGTLIFNQVMRGLTLDSESYYLLSEVDKKTLTVSHSIVISIEYFQDWRYYHSINNIRGEQRGIVVLNRDVKACSSNMFYGCTFQEDLAIIITDGEIINYSDNGGITFRLNSRYKNIYTLIHFPEKYLIAQLNKVAELRSNDTPTL
jgi:hypothetical protein